ncbi:acyltransferase [Brachybacterium sp. Z12]|uniref:acyltransferase family protein n=1 Tax=Brachybacterium sp. Z12 TaxID=2759167 RepID=UPI001861207B|nr:acyltransferase [Brachybacterium sp. Z12]QNN81640.1 acyltransferase [Brachybacterium sp. Z12]
MSGTGAPAAPRARVEIIDYYRLAAALAVMAFHYLYNGIKNGKIGSISHEPVAAIAQYGYLGVNLFFMISGYVITTSVAGKTARQFAVGRALRLYPAFWVALPITAVFALLLGGERMGVTVEQFLANLTMIPTVLGQPFVDGVYWTLLYELQFYVAVFLLILFGQGHRVAALMPAWAIGMLYLTVAAPGLTGSAPLLGNYFIWFAAGAIIASIAESGWSAYRVLGLLATYIPISSLELTLTTVLKTGIFLMVVATVVPQVRNLRLPGSKTAGALTYPVYLLHAHIGYMLLDRFATESNKWLVYGAVAGFVPRPRLRAARDRRTSSGLATLLGLGVRLDPGPRCRSDAVLCGSCPRLRASARTSPRSVRTGRARRTRRGIRPQRVIVYSSTSTMGTATIRHPQVIAVLRS